MGKIVCFIFIVFYLHTNINAQQRDDLIINNYIENYQFKEALFAIDGLKPSLNLLIDKAYCYEQLNNYQKAIEILLPLSQQYDTDQNIKLKLARCYQSVSDWNNSLFCYENLIKLDSTKVYYRIHRADLLFNLKRYNDALEQYNLLITKNDLSNMIKRSALCFENTNQIDSAIIYYKRACEIDSTDVFSKTNLINLYIKTGKSEGFSEAIELSDDFIRRDTTNKQINLLNGMSYYASDMYEQAALRLEKCFSSGDSSLIVNRSLGISYYFLGENEKAFPYLEKAYIMDTTNTNILYSLAVVCNEIAKPELAIRYFQFLLDKVIPQDMTLYLYYKGLANGQEAIKEGNAAALNYKNDIKYAGENQRMYLFFTLASLYDYELDIPKEALEYYMMYKDSLSKYLIKIKENKKTEQPEINQVENKI